MRESERLVLSMIVECSSQNGLQKRAIKRETVERTRTTTKISLRAIH